MSRPSIRQEQRGDQQQLRSAVTDLKAGPLPSLTAALMRLLDHRTTPAAFADQAARWHLVRDRLLDAHADRLRLPEGQP
jgi:hypothetical protein